MIKLNLSDIFEKELTSEEVNEYLKEKIEDKTMMRYAPFQIYNLAKEQYTREQKEKEILSELRERIQPKVRKIHLISEDMAIIETYEKIFGDEEKIWYRTYYKGDIDSGVSTEYDIALIKLIAIKNNNSEATSWILKMLDIKEED